MSVILGIDPGSRITGYGLIKFQGLKPQYISCGCIRTESKELPLRLQQIFDGISEIMREHQPEEVGIEEVFMHRNASAALKLGQARGAAIVAAAIHTVPVSEYSPRQIKQAVVGYGAAQKEQVQHMVCQLLNLSDMPSSDAADALAVAICHAHSNHSFGGLSSKMRVRRGRLR